MKAARSFGIVVGVFFAMACVSSPAAENHLATAIAAAPGISLTALNSPLMVVARQAKAASSAAEDNLFKDALDHREKINWRTPPANAIPSGACTILETCSNPVTKMATLPRKVEGGQAVGRAMFLVNTGNSKNPEGIVIEHQTVTEVYFFKLSPDGSCDKTAYIQRGGSWYPMANSLSQPTFDMDKKVWMAAIEKLNKGEK
jgi:hypothetical protein